MTQDEIIRMAREVDAITGLIGRWIFLDAAHLERFAALVAAHEREKIEAQLKAIRPQGKSWLPMVLEAVLAEREACAKVVESGVLGHGECAAAIRARSENAGS